MLYFVKDFLVNFDRGWQLYGRIGLIYSLLTAKCIDLLIYYITYFKEVNKYYRQFNPLSA